MMRHIASFTLSQTGAYLPVAALLLSGLAGCGPTVPDGQVLAQVAGTEITRRDLAAEPRQEDTSTQTLLEHVIDRKLLVQAARAQNVAADPEYLAAFRRNREELLVAALRRKIVRTLPQPTDAELNTLAAERPWAFGKRELISLTPVASQGEGLANKVIDTAQLDRELWQLVSDDKKPVVIDSVTYRVVARNSAPLEPAAYQSQAKAIWLEDKVSDELARLIREGRSRSALKYSQGMGPAAE